MAKPPRRGLEGVDVGDAPASAWRRAIRSVMRLACDPAAFSAHRYAAQDRMEFAALKPDSWRKPE